MPSRPYLQVNRSKHNLEGSLQSLQWPEQLDGAFSVVHHHHTPFPPVNGSSLRQVCDQYLCIGCEFVGVEEDICKQIVTVR